MEMNSLIIRDLLIGFTKKIKVLMYVLFLVLLYFIFFKFVFPDFLIKNTSELFMEIIGANYNIRSYLDVLLIVLFNVFYVYIALSLYIGDLSQGKEQIFLRMSKLKYVISKLTSITIITILFNIIIYSFLIVVFAIFNCQIPNLIIRIFIIDTLLKLIYQYLSIMFFTFFRNLGTFLLPLILGVVALTRFNYLNFLYPLENLKNIGYILYIYILLLPISIVLLKLGIKDLFEKEEKNEN
jgi:hypothetical protein